MLDFFIKNKTVYFSLPNFTNMHNFLYWQFWRWTVHHLINIWLQISFQMASIMILNLESIYISLLFSSVLFVSCVMYLVIYLYLIIAIYISSFTLVYVCYDLIFIIISSLFVLMFISAPINALLFIIFIIPIIVIFVTAVFIIYILSISKLFYIFL